MAGSRVLSQIVTIGVQGMAASFVAVKKIGDVTRGRGVLDASSYIGRFSSTKLLGGCDIRQYPARLGAQDPVKMLLP